MAGAKTQISNFSHLAVHDERLARLRALVEHDVPRDSDAQFDWSLQVELSV